MGRPRSGHAYRQLRALVFAEESVCWICHKWVDQSIPYRDPMTSEVNMDSKSLDHIEPVVKGGVDERWNSRLAHLGCNVSRGDAKKEDPGEWLEPKKLASRKW